MTSKKPPINYSQSEKSYIYIYRNKFFLGIDSNGNQLRNFKLALGLSTVIEINLFTPQRISVWYVHDIKK